MTAGVRRLNHHREVITTFQANAKFPTSVSEVSSRIQKMKKDLDEIKAAIEKTRTQQSSAINDLQRRDFSLLLDKQIKQGAQIESLIQTCNDYLSSKKAIRDDPLLQDIRDKLAAMADLQLTSDTAVRILTGNTPQPSRVAAALKGLLDILDTVSDPTGFYENLIMGDLEETAIAKLQALDQMKSKVDGEVKNFYDRELKTRQIAKINEKIAGLKKIVKAKQTSYDGAQQEVEGLRKRADELERAIRECQEALKEIDGKLTSYAKQRQSERELASKTGIQPPGVLVNYQESRVLEWQAVERDVMQKSQKELNEVRGKIRRVEAYSAEKLKERDEASDEIESLKREIANLRA